MGTNTLRAVSRSLSLAILVVAVLALVVGRQLIQEDAPGDEGCDGVRRVYERVSFVEDVDDVPSADVFEDAGRAVREAAVVAPAAVALDLNRIADAYGVLARLYRGFDPADASTYDVIEQATGEIEAQEAVVDQARPAVASWLDNRCA
jgi:hypothetical protein